MQQDVEFGVIQIVDIALRAISPAVNDPSTAISCVDQLSCIIICWLGREQPRSTYYALPHVPRLIVPWISFEGLIDTAFDQIRHYAVADLPVSLRLIRALQDIASATKGLDEQQLLVGLARRIVAESQKHLAESELERLKRRVAGLEAQIAAVTSKTAISPAVSIA
jgi:uncharacterized membrane protein